METEARARAERTESMELIAVTLDVSRLSGWLKADAPCRVKKEAEQAGRHAGGRGWGRRRRREQRAGKAPTVQAEGRARAERTENMEPIVVTLDVSKLSGWLNADAFCREKRAQGVEKWVS